MSTNGTHPQRSVVVTGASTGIGEATVLRLDRLGFRVFAGVRKDADGDALRRQGSPSLTPVRIDVTDGTSIEAARETVAALAGGQLAGLVNNAGVAVPGPVEVLPIDEWRRQFEVNVFGLIAVTQAFLPMIRTGRGRVVNIGSIAGRMATPLLGPYTGSKFALEGINDSLRFELRPWGIHVALVEPGSIATKIWEKGDAEADRLEAMLTPDAHRLYDPLIGAVRALVGELGAKGISPEHVAKVIEHALTSKRPKTRYLVGRDARLQAAAKSILPDRLMDRLIAFQVKMPKHAETPAQEAQPDAVPAGRR